MSDLADKIREQALSILKSRYTGEVSSTRAMGWDEALEVVLGLVGEPDDARRYQQLLDDPETARHLLLLLSQKRGDQESFRKMQDRIADSRAAAERQMKRVSPQPAAESDGDAL